jgi:hypothetical protein
MFLSCAQPLKELKRITAIGIHVGNGAFPRWVVKATLVRLQILMTYPLINEECGLR